MFDDWVDSDAPVRISGWLLMDPQHRPHLGRYRKTLWEVHAITKIEVWRNDQWVDLEAVAQYPLRKKQMVLIYGSPE